MQRPNLAMDAPPTEIVVGGASYAANTDYRVWLQVLEDMERWYSVPDSPDKQQSNAEIAAQMQVLVFGGVLVEEDPGQVLDAMAQFAQGYPTAPMQADRATDAPVYSFEWDLNEIILAIRNQSGIDISYRCKYFHWWEFLLEFRTLCGDHYILNLMEARGYKGDNKELLDRKRWCALPVRHTADETAVLEEINELFSGAV